MALARLLAGAVAGLDHLNPQGEANKQALGQAPHTLWPRSLHPHTPQIQKKPQAPLKAQGQAWAPLTHSATHKLSDPA